MQIAMRWIARIVCKKWLQVKDHLKIRRILLAVISRTPIRFHVKWRSACLFSRNEVDKAGHIVQKWQTSANKPRMYRDACNKRANDYNISVVNNEHAGPTQILPLFGSRITRFNQPGIFEWNEKYGQTIVSILLKSVWNRRRTSRSMHFRNASHANFRHRTKESILEFAVCSELCEFTVRLRIRIWI